jgi:hypothetical protein
MAKYDVTVQHGQGTVEDLTLTATSRDDAALQILQLEHLSGELDRGNWNWTEQAWPSGMKIYKLNGRRSTIRITVKKRTR